MAQPNIETRLCSHCANSIAFDALTCPYCKADLLTSAEPEWVQKVEPEWPQKDEHFEPASSSVEKEKLTVRSKAILVLGLAVFAFGVYLVGGNLERHDLRPILEQQQSTIVEKDERIKALEKKLADLRQEHQGSTTQIDRLKAKLQETGNDLVAVRKKLNDANRELARLATSRSGSAQATVTRTARPARPPAAGAALRDRIELGTYETMRPATVHEGPAGSSRVVTQLSKGTQVTVVRAIGNWLEIRSKHGNPPGFVRLDDVAMISPSTGASR